MKVRLKWSINVRSIRHRLTIVVSWIFNRDRESLIAIYIATKAKVFALNVDPSNTGPNLNMVFELTSSLRSLDVATAEFIFMPQRRRRNIPPSTSTPVFHLALRLSHFCFGFVVICGNFAGNLGGHLRVHLCVK